MYTSLQTQNFYYKCLTTYPLIFLLPFFLIVYKSVISQILIFSWPKTNRNRNGDEVLSFYLNTENVFLFFFHTRIYEKHFKILILLDPTNFFASISFFKNPEIKVKQKFFTRNLKKIKSWLIPLLSLLLWNSFRGSHRWNAKTIFS